MLKGVFSAFFGIFKELFKGWPKFWDIMRGNDEISGIEFSGIVTLP